MAYMTKMTRKKRELLALIEREQALPIYQLARLTGRNYRRVYDHVQELAAAGLVGLRQEQRNGRKSCIVESACQQRLNRLNDMYAFQVGLRAA